MARDTRTYISPKLKESIVRDYHDAHLSVSDLGRKYKVAYNTVDKIINTTKYGFWEEAPCRVMPSPVSEIIYPLLQLSVHQPNCVKGSFISSFRG